MIIAIHNCMNRNNKKILLQEKGNKHDIWSFEGY